MDINSLSRDELKALLKDLKLVNSLKKSLGKRSSDEFELIKNGKNKYAVEYFPEMSEDLAYEKSLAVFEKTFGETPARDQIKFEKQESLNGGIRVYKNDQRVDLSFSKIEKQIS